ncbi:MAG TPA: hypothetical protein VH280_02895 [Verrucomicrobiae bacterium]|jgi:hypothetical protein|nr:hypothetical protein [Verrucomicrobiae bacterium]
MRILIENEETSEYLTETHHWSKNPLKGKQFPNRRLAFRAAKLEPIGTFNIVCHIPKTKEFINLDHGQGIGKSATEAGT